MGESCSTLEKERNNPPTFFSEYDMVIDTAKV